MSANYNNSAWFYDKLSRIVYGKALINAQVYLLKYIPPNSKLLIVGGGTGWILEEIAMTNLSGLQITYVEVAANMIRLSQKRSAGNNRITFINDAVENIPLTTEFDAVITPFLLDNFADETLQKVFEHIQVSLKPGGLWLNCSFQLTGKWWQTLLLKSMFLFSKSLAVSRLRNSPELKNNLCGMVIRPLRGKLFLANS